MRILGIDPGAKGALALVGPFGTLDSLHDMPTRTVRVGDKDRTRVDEVRLGELLRDLRPDVAFLEQVGSHSGEGPMGAFAFGRSVGIVQGALGAIGLQATEVPPQSWKRLVGVRKGPDGDRKGPAKARAAKLWPAQASVLLRARADKAEAALIAWYGYLVMSEL